MEHHGVDSPEPDRLTATVTAILASTTTCSLVAEHGRAA